MSSIGYDLYLKAIADHEQSMAQLYHALSRFAADQQQRSLWKRLADEEKSQARLMESLRENGDNFGVTMNHRRPQIIDLYESTAEIIAVTERIDSKGIKGSEGLDLARRFELQDLEQKVYDAFDTEHQELLGLIMTTRMLNDLHPEHLDNIAEMIRKRVFSFSKLFGRGGAPQTSSTEHSGTSILESGEGLGTVRMRILPKKSDMEQGKENGSAPNEKPME